MNLVTTALTLRLVVVLVLGRTLKKESSRHCVVPVLALANFFAPFLIVFIESFVSTKIFNKAWKYKGPLCCGVSVTGSGLMLFLHVSTACQQQSSNYHKIMLLHYKIFIDAELHCSIPDLWNVRRNAAEPWSAVPNTICSFKIYKWRLLYSQNLSGVDRKKVILL